MKITSFSPLIVTKDAEPVIKLFEELGFERRHSKEGIGINSVRDIRMKDPNGFHVDITQGTGAWTMIRMNVDDLEETIEFLESRGFHKARHEAANETIDRYGIFKDQHHGVPIGIHPGGFTARK